METWEGNMETWEGRKRRDRRRKNWNQVIGENLKVMRNYMDGCSKQGEEQKRVEPNRIKNLFWHIS